MQKTPCWVTLAVLPIALSIPSIAEAGSLKLASLFTDNMVLQRDRPIPVWGTAENGAKVAVELNGRKAASRTVDGRWSVRLPAMKQGGPFVMTVSAGDERIVLGNVLIGEVWIASGQSNMEFVLSGAMNATDEVAGASYPNIRFFTVERATSFSPLDSVKGSWVECTPRQARAFSAVAYFFARKLATEEGLNVGIIHTSWGGTPAEAWTGEAPLRSVPELSSLLAPLEAFKSGPESGKQEIERKLAEWEKFWDDVFEKNAELAEGWAAPGANLSGWSKTEVPRGASLFSTMDGVVWYRREVDVPAAWAGKDLILHLGPIDDFDNTYFNGKEIGRITKSTPGWYITPRDYTVPGALVRPGKNTIAIRIVDSYLGGGFGGEAEAMQLQLKGAPGTVPLAGSWAYRVAFQYDPKRDPAKPEQGDESQMPTLLYNAMIAPLIPYAIRGAIWYQGESNVARYVQYRKLFPVMIDSWRKAWKQGDFPFYFVQLASFLPQLDVPSDSEWAGLREAQSLTLRLKNTGMAVAIDLGDAGNIHPTNKQDVGRRLALWAQAQVYGRKGLEYSGPLYRKMKVKGNSVVVSFDHAKGGLAVRGGGKLEGFAVAGPDGAFVWADALIDGESVIVSSPAVADPRAVRYGWADNPAANLTNRAGLPASPFRTDVRP